MGQREHLTRRLADRAAYVARQPPWLLTLWAFIHLVLEVYARHPDLLLCAVTGLWLTTFLACAVVGIICIAPVFDLSFFYGLVALAHAVAEWWRRRRG